MNHINKGVVISMKKKRILSVLAIGAASLMVIASLTACGGSSGGSSSSASDAGSSAEGSYSSLADGKVAAQKYIAEYEKGKSAASFQFADGAYAKAKEAAEKVTADSSADDVKKVVTDLALESLTITDEKGDVTVSYPEGDAGKNLKGPKKWIFDWAFRIATRYDYENPNKLYQYKYEIADKLVYSKWRENLSGKEMTVVSGGSSIPEKVIRLFTAAKVRIYEGYGLTETSPVIAVNVPRKHMIRVGCVGEILPTVECKIAPDGEILTKGPCLMKGYYKDEAYTREVIDEDGWFHTGDIGTIVDGKFLKVTDRKKEIFKLSLGKYIAPQVVETKLRESPFVDNAMVIGENEKFASALIVPLFDKMDEAFKKRRIEIPKDRTEYMNHPYFMQLISREVDLVNKTLADHEQIKRFRLIGDVWSTESGELSQTLKLKRKVIYQKYDSICREIYNYDKN